MQDLEAGQLHCQWLLCISQFEKSDCSAVKGKCLDRSKCTLGEGLLPLVPGWETRYIDDTRSNKQLPKEP